ncbi:hypothetical protein M153_3930002556 [Pseudoloma neurophilia]|uniref:Uncharacterized protein n=1 Tax=Pseudoloma neurophilia TaxID=146866 RepID=A0A0R0LXK6_9MICR|nr:hypothetical protein M153_3930002556 [Pseudoloma neurophilia]
MFVLHNLKNNKPLTIKKINNRYELILDTSFYVKYAKEKPIEDSLIVCESEEPNSISNITNVRSAGFFEFETIVKDKSDTETTALKYEELQNLHGSKISRKILKSLNQNESNLNLNDIGLSENASKEQIIPNFNKDATEPKDIYTLSLMFDPYLLNQIKEYEFDEQNLHIENYEYYSQQKIPFIILDTVLYVLKKKFIPEKMPHKDISYDILSQILSQGNEQKHLVYNKMKNYNHIEKMKFIAMAYIMILKINRYKVDLTTVPRFNLTDQEIENIFKLLGCKIDRNKAVLRGPPKPTVDRRRNKRR